MMEQFNNFIHRAKITLDLFEEFLDSRDILIPQMFAKEWKKTRRTLEEIHRHEQEHGYDPGQESPCPFHEFDNALGLSYNWVSVAEGIPDRFWEDTSRWSEPLGFNAQPYTSDEQILWDSIPDPDEIQKFLYVMQNDTLVLNEKLAESIRWHVLSDRMLANLHSKFRELHWFLNQQVEDSADTYDTNAASGEVTDDVDTGGVNILPPDKYGKCTPGYLGLEVDWEKRTVNIDELKYRFGQKKTQWEVFKLLFNSGETHVSTEDVIEEVWPNKGKQARQSVHRTMNRLRATLRDAEFCITICQDKIGSGYRLEELKSVDQLPI